MGKYDALLEKGIPVLLLCRNPKQLAPIWGERKILMRILSSEKRVKMAL